MFYIIKKLTLQSDFFTKIICFSLFINIFFIFLFFVYSVFKLRSKFNEAKEALKNIKNFENFNFEEIKSEVVKIMIKSSEKFNYQNLKIEEKEKIWDLILNNYLSFENNIILFFNASASVSTLIGLLGTVWGIINAFMGIASSGGGDLAVVAPGIAEALITTIAGLFVAIPAILFSFYLKYLRREIIMKYKNIYIYINSFLLKKNND